MTSRDQSEVLVYNITGPTSRCVSLKQQQGSFNMEGQVDVPESSLHMVGNLREES